MARDPKHWSTNNFNAGIVQDIVGAEGALWDLVNGYIERSGEIRARGGKPLINTADDLDLEGFLAFRSSTVPGGIGFLLMCPTTGSDLYIKGIGGATFTRDRKFAWLAGSGWSTSNTLSPIDKSTITVTDNEILFSLSNGIGRWGGGYNAIYSTGTVSGTSGNFYATGAGGATFDSTMIGSYLLPSAGKEVYRVVSVSGSELILDRALQGNLTASTYAVTPFALVSCDGFANNYNNAMDTALQTNGKQMAYHNGRLFVSGVTENIGSGSGGASPGAHLERIRWSALPGEAINALSPAVSGIDYWEDDAYADIAPGEGGIIQGLMSNGRELLILKSHAVHVLRGDTATDGTDLGARVDVVSRTEGAATKNSMCSIKSGIVFANANGAYIYAEGMARSITDGRISTLWKSNDYYSYVYSARDRVFFCADDGLSAIVWDSLRNIFYRQETSDAFGMGVDTYSPLEFFDAEYVITAGAVADNAGDFTDSGSDYGATDTDPQFMMKTHSIPMSRSKVGHGRVINAYIRGYNDSPNADGTGLRVKVHASQVGAEDITSGVVEGEAETSSSPRTYRYAIGSAVSPLPGAPHVQLEVYNGAPGAGELRVFAIGLDFFTTDSINPEGGATP